MGRAGIVLLGLGLAGVIGWVLFVEWPGSLAELLGVVLVLVAVATGGRLAARLAGTALPGYNVAEVTVDGPITRDGGGVLPSRPGGTTADDVVAQIEQADEDRGADALLVKLNTPGGEVVPSDDIRRAVAAFDGPTVAYATDVCASGGYWIASGCDEIWARDASIVGSIGVLGSLVTAEGLARRLGLSYERFAAGEFKDAGTPLREITDEERDYLQGLIDGYYEQFVDRVTEGRELEPGDVRDTEARVYLGSEALELGLVDALGAREQVEDRLEELLDEPVAVKEFVPQRSLAQRLRRGANGIAYALGAGAIDRLAGDGEFGFQVR